MALAWPKHPALLSPLDSSSREVGCCSLLFPTCFTAHPLLGFSPRHGHDTRSHVASSCSRWSRPSLAAQASSQATRCGSVVVPIQQPERHAWRLSEALTKQASQLAVREHSTKVLLAGHWWTRPAHFIGGTPPCRLALGPRRPRWSSLWPLPCAFSGQTSGPPRPSSLTTN